MGGQGGGTPGGGYGIEGYLKDKTNQRMAVDNAFKKDSGNIYEQELGATDEDEESKKKVTNMLDEMNNMKLAEEG